MKYFTCLVVMMVFSSSCSVGIKMAAGGETYVYMDGRIICNRYENRTMGLKSHNGGIDSLQCSKKSLKRFNLPAGYKRLLFNDRTYNPELLWFANKDDVLSNYVVFVIAYDSSELEETFGKRMADAISGEVSNDKFSLAVLSDGRRVFCHEYSLLASRKKCMNVTTYYTNWRQNKVLALTRVSYETNYGRIHNIDDIFQTIDN